MFYVLDENKNLVESFDKEGFLALLEQIIEDESLENIPEDTAVASKLRSIINGSVHHVEFVTQAQFSALETGGDLVPNTYYFIIDDTTIEDYEAALAQLQGDLNGLQGNVTDLQGDVTNIKSLLNFSSLDDSDFVTYTVRENGTTTVSNVVPDGLYLAKVYNHTIESPYLPTHFVVILFVSYKTTDQKRSGINSADFAYNGNPSSHINVGLDDRPTSESFVNYRKARLIRYNPGTGFQEDYTYTIKLCKIFS